MDRKLIDYLPPFLREYKEIAAIMGAEQDEIDRAWFEAENALSDQFIMEATENGVKRWESMLGISPKDTDTLEERRFRILTTANQELPYTMAKLVETLTLICGGVRNFTLSYDFSQCWIKVLLAIENQNNYQEVVDLLKKMVPANMECSVEIMYAPHKNLTKYTHQQLAAYRHKEIREVFV